jgi:mRNA-degrading endonuclease RelE of RelBE toxin-antitoxin system
MTTKPPVRVELTQRFVKVVKRLRKKYPSVPANVQALMDRLEQGETPGDQMQGIGHTTYKTRLPNPDAQRGKSGSFRVIYYLKLADLIILLMIYSKTDQIDISPDEVKRLIDEFESPPR